jgi:hypothetical protein
VDLLGQTHNASTLPDVASIPEFPPDGKPVQRPATLVEDPEEGIPHSKGHRLPEFPRPRAFPSHALPQTTGVLDEVELAQPTIQNDPAAVQLHSVLNRKDLG